MVCLHQFDKGCSLVTNPQVLTLFCLTNLNTFLSFLYRSGLLVISVLHFMGESYFCPLNSIFLGQDLLPTIVIFLRVVYIGLSTLILFPTTLKGFCLKVVFAFNVFDYFPLWPTRGIRHLHISHNAPYLLPKILHNLCFFISHGYYSRLTKKLKTMLLQKFWGANKVHYGKCASGVLATVILDSLSGAYSKEKGGRGCGLLPPL